MEILYLGLAIAGVGMLATIAGALALIAATYVTRQD